VPPSSNPSRILIVRLSHLGDVVHALPVFHALRERFPEGRIAWAVQPEFADLVGGLSGVTRTILFDRRGGIGAWPRLWRELRRFRPDWTIDAQGNWKSAAVTRLSRARRRSGFHRSEWREPLGWLALNDRCAPTPLPPPVHALDRGLHLARTLTGLEPAWVPEDWFELTEEERRGGEERWRERLGDADGPIVLLQLAAAGDPRAWPESHQRELLRELGARGVTTLALSGPGEAELGTRFERELAGEPRIAHWVDQRGLRELAAFFTTAAERGARLCSGDSGPMHLAAACGLPVLALAGPQDPRRTGPWPTPEHGGPHRVLHAAPSPECAPCCSRTCAHPEGAVCLRDITPAMVAEALLNPANRPASPAS